jgi:hypothetical protein
LREGNFTSTNLAETDLSFPHKPPFLPPPAQIKTRWKRIRFIA